MINVFLHIFSAEFFFIEDVTAFIHCSLKFISDLFTYTI